MRKLPSVLSNQIYGIRVVNGYYLLLVKDELLCWTAIPVIRWIVNMFILEERLIKSCNLIDLMWRYLLLQGNRRNGE